jgi:hypothetical protein
MEEKVGDKGAASVFEKKNYIQKKIVTLSNNICHKNSSDSKAFEKSITAIFFLYYSGPLFRGHLIYFVGSVL